MQEILIPGIYNYCNRWCERCQLARRCAVYTHEQAAIAKNQDITDPDNKAFWGFISEAFGEAMKMLQELAEAEGIKLDDIEEIKLEQEQSREAVEQVDFVKSATAYAEKARKWLGAKQNVVLTHTTQQMEMGLPQAKEEGCHLSDALEVISWYLFQISVKLQRAQSGYHEFLAEPELELDLADVNGSAKVALLGIEHSLAAWSILYKHLPDEQDELLTILALLQRTRRKALQQFPGAMSFKRPGFDD